MGAGFEIRRRKGWRLRRYRAKRWRTAEQGRSRNIETREFVFRWSARRWVREVKPGGRR